MNLKIEIPAVAAIATKLLHRQFIDSSRADAKRAFRVLEEGKPLLLSDIKMDDGSVVRFSAALQLEEFRGRMNFTCLRNQVQGLCQGLEKAIAEGQELRVMSDEAGQQHAIFMPLISEIDGLLNALVLAVDCRRSGELRMQLMYVDPEQFRSSAA